MKKKQIRQLTNKQLEFKINSLKNTIGVEPGEKFIQSKFFWNGLYELVILLIRLFKENKRRKAK